MMFFSCGALGFLKIIATFAIPNENGVLAQLVER